MPLERATGVLELLVQDPSARIDGGHLTEIAPVSADGRTFRRFQSQGVDSNAVVRIELPQAVGSGRLRVIAVVAVAIVAAMIATLVVAARRPRRPRRIVVGPSARVAAESPADALVRAIATLDSEFEARERTDANRDAYAAQRAALKARLADMLAAGTRSG
jgi:hypothetical protein